MVGCQGLEGMEWRGIGNDCLIWVSIWNDKNVLKLDNDSYMTLRIFLMTMSCILKNNKFAIYLLYPPKQQQQEQVAELKMILV